MRRDDPQGWMWSEAIAMLARAERMHQRFFQPHPTTWEPPVDVLELDHEVLILVALPGIDLDKVEAVIEGDTLVVTGKRAYPPEFHTATIHRLELPQGRFERRVPLPAGRYSGVQRSAVNGCLALSLRKAV